MVKKSTINDGLLNLSILHTSCSLMIQENADPTVMLDIKNFLKKIAPEGNYFHDTEGRDDMPAHLKSSILGSSVSIPITDGKLNLGVWQGIYLCEHRDHGTVRKLIATIQGLAQ